MERKKELERERHQLIQTNIFFSSKCEEYKKKLADLVAEGKELERELVFLDGQIESTTKRKFQVLSSPEQREPRERESGQGSSVQEVSLKHETPPSTLPILSDRKQGGSSSRKLMNSVSVKSTNKRALI